MIEKKQTDVMPQAMHLGLYMGLYETVKFILSVTGGKNNVISYFYVLLAVLTPVVAYFIVKRFKQRTIIPDIRFGQLYSFTVFLFLFSAMIVAIAQYVYMQYINPTFLSQVTDASMNLMTQLGKADDYKAAIDAQGAITPIKYAVMNIYINMLYGAIIGLPIALIVNKLKK
ncbi:MAG: DUF4199 domain-containing protein [Bacteroidales bacterium]